MQALRIKNILIALLLNFSQAALATQGGNQITGHCFDPNGNPVAGLTINLNGNNTGNNYTTISAADGSYSFSNLADDAYLLNAYGNGLQSNPLLLPLTNACTQEEDLWNYPLNQGGLVSQTLVFSDPANGPIANLQVALTGPSGALGGITDASGSVSFGPIPAGSYQVYAVAPGYKMGATTLQINGSRRSSNFNLLANPSLPSTAMLAGQIKAADGTNLANLQILLQGSFGSLSVTTDVNGTFLVDNLTANGSVKLTVQNNPALVSTQSLGSNSQGAQQLVVTVPGNSILFSSLRFNPASAQAARPAGQASTLSKPCLAYHSQDRSTYYFAAANGSQNLKVQIYTLLGQKVSELDASAAGQVLSFQASRVAQGIYLARFSFTDAQGQAQNQTQKIAIY